MNISKQSWHYGVVSNKFCFMDGWWASNSLCLYFWQVVMRISFGFLLCLLAVSPLVLIMQIALGSSPTLLGVLGLIIGLLYIFVLLIFIVLCIGEVYRKVRRTFPHKEPKKPSEPNILIEYIKAKKDKVCPMITYV
jgi:Na+-transporting methylmalonyl-CoA/oxaloacetate decarboxylase gamma subunit